MDNRWTGGPVAALSLVVEFGDAMEASLSHRRDMRKSIRASETEIESTYHNLPAQGTDQRSCTMLPHLQPRVHPNNTPHNIPISLMPHPITNHNPRAPIAYPFRLLHHIPLIPLNLIVPRAQKLHNCWIEFRRNPIRPAPDFPEIARCQEIDEEGLLRWGTFLGFNRAREGANALRCAHEVLLRVLDLLLDVFRLKHLVEILHADVSAGARRIRRVICPLRSVDTPACAAPFVVQPAFEVKASDKDYLPTRFPEGGDPWLSEPAVIVSSVVVAHNPAELLIGRVTGAFALDRHDERFAGVVVEKGVNFVEEVFEVLITCKGDWEYCVHKDQPIITRVFRLFGLHADVEEADTVVELFGWGGRLAPHGWEGSVVGGGVVRSWD